MRLAPTPYIPAVLKIFPDTYRYRLAFGPRFLKDPIRFLNECVRECGDIVALSPGRVFFVNHPNFIKHVLQDNHPNYRKGSNMTKMLMPYFGQGLLTSEGAFWKRQRRLAQPAFHRRHSPELADLMKDTIGVTLRRWETTARDFRDFREDLTEMILTIVLKGLLGTDWGENPEALLKAVEDLEEALALVASFIDPFQAPLWMPTRRNLAIKRALRSADHWIYRLIDARRKHPGGEDLLALFLAAKDTETGETMSDQQARDEMLTVLRTGHSTIRELVLWTWYLFSMNPDAERRFYDEVDTVLEGRPPQFEDLPKLTYTLKALHESMRLYPPAWVFVRAAIAEDEIGGYHIPAGAMVVVCPFVTHRSETWWPEPEQFDPERFALERMSSQPKFAYFPFGGGSRLCIGNHFALMEAQLILSMTAQKFRIERDVSSDVRRVLFVSCMAHDLRLRMIPRTRSV